ncbi:MAG TPA: hypothetical protein PKY46_00915 [Ignavibacteriaceae bacterium]|mgnify:FL=1|nr:hypothetical protein [Ignavibacteriaceae bacterium]
MIEKIKKAWAYIEGQKRRIALIAAFVTQLTPEYTVLYAVAQGTFLLFASADLLQYSSTKIKNIRKVKE